MKTRVNITHVVYNFLIFWAKFCNTGITSTFEVCLDWIIRYFSFDSAYSCSNATILQMVKFTRAILKHLLCFFNHANYNAQYMIASTQITNTEIFAIVAVLVFKLLSPKVLFINRIDSRNCQKVGYFLRI